MVDWYKHDIPDWMDGTEGLDAEPYRTYHIICQLIYLHEGPIALNEHGIAGRCKQSIRTFRTSLNTLIEAGKITLSDGRLSNSRAKKELEKVSENRLNASKGGQKSSEVRNQSSKPLKTNGVDQASLKDSPSLIEKTRLEKKEHTAKAEYDEKFEEAWRAYPRRDGGNPKPPAAKLFLGAVKSGADPQDIIIGAQRFATSEARNVGTPYIPQMVKWLRDKRWLDYAAGTCAAPTFDIRAHLP